MATDRAYEHSRKSWTGSTRSGQWAAQDPRKSDFGNCLARWRCRRWKGGRMSRSEEDQVSWRRSWADL